MLPRITKTHYIAAALGLACMPCWGQNAESSLRDTLEFLSGKIQLAGVSTPGQRGGKPVRVALSYTASTIDSCTMTLHKRLEVTGRGQKPGDWIWKFSLSNIDSVTTVRGPFLTFGFVGNEDGRRDYGTGLQATELTLYSNSSAISYEFRRDGVQFVTGSPEKAASVVFPDDVLAQKVKTAFNHATELCKKKESSKKNPF